MFRRLVSNPGVKIFAVVLATVYWFFISAPRRERLFDRAFEVPLAFVGVPHELIMTTRVQENINVRLRGRLSVLRQLSSQNLEATLDLSSITKAGDVTIPIRPSAISLPPDVEVVGVDPGRVVLRLEPRRQKIVPVREYLVGDLPTGYSVGPVTVEPKNALISGPLTVIRNVTEVATDRIILSGRAETFSRTVGLVPENPLVSVVDPASVLATVVVVPPGQVIGPSPAPSTSPGQ